MTRRFREEGITIAHTEMMLSSLLLWVSVSVCRGFSASLTRSEIERYSRHLILSEVGVSGQEKLKNGRVLCVGAGGLGSPALMYLAAAGVGHLTVIDDDVVESSNLQRQIVHSSDAVGEYKAQSAADTIYRVNPEVVVTQVRERLTRENVRELVESHDVVLDGCDNFPTKFLIDDACLELGKPNVYAAILRFEGQASVFNWPPGQGATYRDLLAEEPPPGAVPTCAEGGVLGVLCGVLGSIQATEVIKILLGRPVHETLANRLLCYDALTMSFSEIDLVKKERRNADKVEESSTVEDTSSPPPFEQIDATTVANRLADGWQPFVLDVRLPQEVDICALPFADANCPHREVASISSSLPKNTDILVHCKSGFRSKLACETLARLGHSRLFSLDGGILAWANEVDPRLPRY